MYLYLDIEKGWIPVPVEVDTETTRQQFGCGECGSVVWNTTMHDTQCTAAESS